MDPTPEEIDQLRRRVELLERENERLRRKLDPMLGPDNPCFDPRLFMTRMQRILMVLMLPAYLIAIPLLLAVLPNSPVRRLLPTEKIGPVPLVDAAGNVSGFRGLGFGIVAMGGASVGVIALGGLAVGVVAIGGGAIGVFAIGGGSAGLIAIGGGAIGFIAIGGSATGYYALGQRVFGKFGLGLNRQDPEAIELFCSWFPWLRPAVTTAMPVIQRGTPAERT